MGSRFETSLKPSKAKWVGGYKAGAIDPSKIADEVMGQVDGPWLTCYMLRRFGWPNFGDPPAAKAIPPRGFEARGLVMANIAGLWLLREGSWPAELAEHHRQLWIVEGEPDTLTIASAIPATRSCHRAVWGVYNGSWTAELAARVPDNADVVLGIHDDEAGRKYRDKVDRTLHGRVRLRVHVPKKPREA